MNIERIWAMPNSRTFSIPPIRDLLAREVGGGLWIDPFSCGARVAHITNDLNPDVDAGELDRRREKVA